MKLCETNDGNFITYDSKTSTFDYADKYKCSLNTRDGYFSSKPSEKNKTFLRMNDDRRLDFISLNYMKKDWCCFLFQLDWEFTDADTFNNHPLPILKDLQTMLLTCLDVN